MLSVEMDFPGTVFPNRFVESVSLNMTFQICLLEGIAPKAFSKLIYSKGFPLSPHRILNDFVGALWSSMVVEWRPPFILLGF